MLSYSHHIWSVSCRIYTKKFGKNNYEYIANEFEFIKKSLFVGLPILVIVVIVSQLLSHFQITLPFSLYDAVFAILVVL